MKKQLLLAAGLFLMSGAAPAEGGGSLGGTVNDVTTGLTGTLSQTLLLLDTSTGALLGVDVGLDGLAETIDATGSGVGGSAEMLVDGLSGDAGLDDALDSTLAQLPATDDRLVLPGLETLDGLPGLGDAAGSGRLSLPGIDALPLTGLVATRKDDPSLPGVRTLPLPGLDALPIPVR